MLEEEDVCDPLGLGDRVVDTVEQALGEVEELPVDDPVAHTDTLEVLLVVMLPDCVAEVEGLEEEEMDKLSLGDTVVLPLEHGVGDVVEDTEEE